ncbi:MAG TPA: aspartyl protease family protein, partial [Vicinamibacterales bacterium]|nr:aspartyl protease family protein [Vicinamibacterales bacterium]
MRSGSRLSAVPVLVVVFVFCAAAAFVIHADGTPPSQAAEIQLQLGTMLYAEGRYVEALEAYENAIKVTDTSLQRSARAGLITSALRVAEFDLARHEAETLVKIAPRDASAVSLYADALWASGLFEEAEGRYRDSLSLQPDLARGLHGVARSLLARNQLDDAMVQAQAALRLAPRDLEVHHTVGAIYERMHKYEEAAVAYGNYVNLLPNKDTSEKAAWSRAEIRFLRSFAQRVPFQAEPGTDDQVFTVDFRLVNDKVVVRARVNDASPQDFVVDTGAESTIITEPTARRLGVAPITYTLSAGVGETGLRGLQLARVDSLELGTLKLRNVPCIIKSPPLRDLPSNETESLSPIALGYSMIIDYQAHKLTFGKHLPIETGALELPLRVYRLVTVRGLVGSQHQANFVVDTGGEVIS